MNRLPKLSHLQYLALQYLTDYGKEAPGQWLHDNLIRLKACRSSPAFYQLMSRMKQYKYVKRKKLNKLSYYSITDLGSRLLKEIKEFYS